MLIARITWGHSHDSLDVLSRQPTGFAAAEVCYTIGSRQHSRDSCRARHIHTNHHTSLLTSGKQKILHHSDDAVVVQDGTTGEQDEEAEREGSLLQIELETIKAVEQVQMLQQVSIYQRTPLSATSACLKMPSVSNSLHQHGIHEVLCRQGLRACNQSCMLDRFCHMLACNHAISLLYFIRLSARPCKADSATAYFVLQNIKSGLAMSCTCPYPFMLKGVRQRKGCMSK